MSLWLHTDQFPTPGSNLLARVGVLEPQHVGYEGGVPQQQDLWELPADDLRENGREHEVSDRKPDSCEEDAHDGPTQDLGYRVVLQVDAADAHEEGHQ
mgnify:CR=1 FL=1